jgi:hypothetical protein
VRTYAAQTDGPPARAWALMAEPRLWSRWAPHLRGAWGLGEPEVTEGARGAVRLLGAVPIPATILAVDPGRSWTWRVGPVEMVHRVEPAPGGCVVAVDLAAPAALEAALRRSYGPLIALLVRHLARVAAS